MDSHVNDLEETVLSPEHNPEKSAESNQFQGIEQRYKQNVSRIISLCHDTSTYLCSEGGDSNNGNVDDANNIPVNALCHTMDVFGEGNEEDPFSTVR